MLVDRAPGPDTLVDRRRPYVRDLPALGATADHEGVHAVHVRDGHVDREAVTARGDEESDHLGQPRRPLAEPLDDGPGRRPDAHREERLRRPAASSPAPREGAPVAWLGVAAAAVAHRLFTARPTRVRATTAGTSSLAEPLAAALIGVLLPHEHLTAPAGAGCAPVLAGTVITCLPPLPRRRAPSPEDLGPSTGRA
jgi:hypothetical protein